MDIWIIFFLCSSFYNLSVYQNTKLYYLNIYIYFICHLYLNKVRIKKANPNKQINKTQQKHGQVLICKLESLRPIWAAIGFFMGCIMYKISPHIIYYMQGNIYTFFVCYSCICVHINVKSLTVPTFHPPDFQKQDLSWWPGVHQVG